MKRRQSNDWQGALTEAERGEMSDIEGVILEWESKIAAAKWRRHKIQNRATQRAKYQRTKP